MKTILRLLNSLRRSRRMFNKPLPMTITGSVLHEVLMSTRHEALTSRRSNYRRSIRRILDIAKAS